MEKATIGNPNLVAALSASNEKVKMMRSEEHPCPNHGAVVNWNYSQINSGSHGEIPNEIVLISCCPEAMEKEKERIEEALGIKIQWQ